MSTSKLSNASKSIAPITFNDETDVFQKVVRKHCSTACAPLPFRQFLKELRRHTVDIDSISNQFSQCEKLVYQCDTNSVILKLTFNGTEIDYDPNKHGITHVQKAVLKAPNIVIINVHIAEAEDITTFHGCLYKKAMCIDIAPWFLKYLALRTDPVRIDAYNASDKQIRQVLQKVTTKTSLRIRSLSNPLYSRISWNCPNVRSVWLDLTPYFVVPIKEEIILDASKGQHYAHQTVIENIPQLTRSFTFLMGSRTSSSNSLPPFNIYFKMHLERLSLYFEYINHEINIEMSFIFDEIVTIIVRLLKSVDSYRADTNVTKLIELNFKYLWNCEGCNIDMKKLKQAVLTDLTLATTMHIVLESTGVPCNIDIKYGHTQGTHKHLLFLKLS